MILPEVYDCLIKRPYLASEEIVDELYNSGILDRIPNSDNPEFAAELYALVDSVVMSSTPCVYDVNTLPTTVVYEVRIIDNNHVVLTFLPCQCNEYNNKSPQYKTYY